MGLRLRGVSTVNGLRLGLNKIWDGPPLRLGSWQWLTSQDHAKSKSSHELMRHPV